MERVGSTKRYAVDVVEHVHTTLYVDAASAAEAKQKVMNGVWPSGIWRRIVRRVVVDR